MLDGTVDVVLNGYELTPERQRDYLCTRPYYLYGLQLMRRRDGTINSWADVRAQQPGGASAGALSGSAAYRYLEANFAGQIELSGFDGNTNAMERVRVGALDFTLQDDCIAIFYAERFPELKFVGRPVDEGYYVALVSKEEPRLHAALNGPWPNHYGRRSLSHITAARAVRPLEHVGQSADARLARHGGDRCAPLALVSGNRAGQWPDASVRGGDDGGAIGRLDAACNCDRRAGRDRSAVRPALAGLAADMVRGNTCAARRCCFSFWRCFISCPNWG